MQYAPIRPDFRFKQDGSYTRPTPVSGGFRRKAKAERRERVCPECRLEVSRAGICVNC